MKSIKQRFLIIAVVLTVVFAVIGSAVFSAQYSSHNCHGDSCTVCEQLASCDRILHNDSNGSAAPCFTATVLAVLILVIRPVAVRRRTDTPITLKTELLD